MRKLFFIFILGLILRFAFLNHFPVSLNWDEISHGYNAYSILKTGKDEWGSRFPLIFRAFGDYKLPVYIYATVIPVALFGLNEFSVRFVSALAGSLAILGIYFLSRELFKENKTALLSAFLLAISPWHFFISRPALEANLALTLIIFGAYFLIQGFNPRKQPGLNPIIISSILFALSLHTYNTARVFVPLLLFAFFTIYRPKIYLNRYTFIAAAIFIAALGLVLYQVKTGEAVARYQKLTILSPDRVFQIGKMRQESRLPQPVPRLIYNRPVYFLETFIKNYVLYFTPQFITQSKGAQSQFAIPGENLIGTVVAFLSIVGLVFAVKHRKSGTLFIFLWLILAPVAAATTIDPPQALRPNPMIPPLIIFAALAISTSLRLKDKKYFYLAVTIPMIEMGLYLSNYFGSYARTYSSSWQYGYQQVFNLLSNYPDKKIIITKRYGEPHIFYAFYTRLNPQVLQDNQQSLRYRQSDWFWTDRINNIYFVNDWDIPTDHTEQIRLESGGAVSVNQAILVTSPSRLPQNAAPIETINFLDGSPAFMIANF